MIGRNMGNGSRTPGSEWICSKCGINNYNARRTCFKCGALRQSSQVPDVRGHTMIGVAPCDTLIVRELPTSATEASIRTMIARSCDQISIKRVEFDRMRTFAFIQMRSIGETVRAHQALQKHVPYVDNCPVIVTFSRQSLDQVVREGRLDIAPEESVADPEQPKSKQQLAATPFGILPIFPIPDPKAFQFEPSSGYFFDPSTGYYYDSRTEYFYTPKSNKWMFWCNAFCTYIDCEGGDQELKRRLQEEDKIDESAKQQREEKAVAPDHCAALRNAPPPPARRSAFVDSSREARKGQSEMANEGEDEIVIMEAPEGRTPPSRRTRLSTPERVIRGSSSRDVAPTPIAISNQNVVLASLRECLLQNREMQLGLREQLLTTQELHAVGAIQAQLATLSAQQRTLEASMAAAEAEGTSQSSSSAREILLHTHQVMIPAQKQAPQLTRNIVKGSVSSNHYRRPSSSLELHESVTPPPSRWDCNSTARAAAKPRHHFSPDEENWRMQTDGGFLDEIRFREEMKQLQGKRENLRHKSRSRSQERRLIHSHGDRIDEQWRKNDSHRPRHRSRSDSRYRSNRFRRNSRERTPPGREPMAISPGLEEQRGLPLLASAITMGMGGGPPMMGMMPAPPEMMQIDRGPMRVESQPSFFNDGPPMGKHPRQTSSPMMGPTPGVPVAFLPRRSQMPQAPHRTNFPRGEFRSQQQRQSSERLAPNAAPDDDLGLQYQRFPGALSGRATVTMLIPARDGMPLAENEAPQQKLARVKRNLELSRKKQELSTKERERVREWGICFNCGRQGHDQFHCSFARISDDQLQKKLREVKERLNREAAEKLAMRHKAEKYPVRRKDPFIRRLREVAPHGKITKEMVRNVCQRCAFLNHSEYGCVRPRVSRTEHKEMCRALENFTKVFFVHLQEENLVDFSQKFDTFTVMDAIEQCATIDPVGLQLHGLCPGDGIVTQMDLRELCSSCAQLGHKQQECRETQKCSRLHYDKMLTLVKGYRALVKEGKGNLLLPCTNASPADAVVVLKESRERGKDPVEEILLLDSSDEEAEAERRDTTDEEGRQESGEKGEQTTGEPKTTEAQYNEADNNDNESKEGEQNDNKGGDLEEDDDIQLVL